MHIPHLCFKFKKNPVPRRYNLKCFDPNNPIYISLVCNYYNSFKKEAKLFLQYMDHRWEPDVQERLVPSIITTGQVAQGT